MSHEGAALPATEGLQPIGGFISVLWWQAMQTRVKRCHRKTGIISLDWLESLPEFNSSSWFLSVRFEILDHRHHPRSVCIQFLLWYFYTLFSTVYRLSVLPYLYQSTVKLWSSEMGGGCCDTKSSPPFFTHRRVPNRLAAVPGQIGRARRAVEACVFLAGALSLPVAAAKLKPPLSKKK